MKRMSGRGTTSRYPSVPCREKQSSTISGLTVTATHRQNYLTASTILVVIIAFLGVGILVRKQQVQPGTGGKQRTRVELSLMRATQTNLEKSVAHLDLLPPLADADWEKVLTDQDQRRCCPSWVRITNLTYSSRVDENEGGVGSIDFVGSGGQRCGAGQMLSPSRTECRRDAVFRN